MSDVPQAGRPSGPRTPGATDVFTLLVIVSAVAATARVVGGRGIVTPWVASMAVGVWAGTVGLPVVVWLSEHGRTGFATVAGAGALAGLIPPALLVLSGVVGLFARGGADNVRWVLEHGASIPLYGTLPWPRFGWFVGWSAMVGSASGILYWLLRLRARLSHPSTWLLVALTMTGVAGFGWWSGR